MVDFPGWSGGITRTCVGGTQEESGSQEKAMCDGSGDWRDALWSHSQTAQVATRMPQGNGTSSSLRASRRNPLCPHLDLTQWNCFRLPISRTVRK